MSDAPLPVVTRMAHAALAQLAGRCGADVLHIKGVATDPSLALPNRTGTDADVLVRPSHVDRFVATLRQHGWNVQSRFGTGSPFAHATTLVHPAWRHADVHRLFPGIEIDPETAFEHMWRTRGARTIARTACAVPDVTTQRVILVLNAARRGTYARTDVERAWTTASASEQAGVLSRVRELHAEVAFAAATGDLERFRGARTYDLWKVTTTGGSRTAEWWARVKAAPTLREAARVVLLAPLVNVDHLTVRLGRRPTRREVAAEAARRVAMATREAIDAAAERIRRAR